MRRLALVRSARALVLPLPNLFTSKSFCFKIRSLPNPFASKSVRFQIRSLPNPFTSKSVHFQIRSLPNPLTSKSVNFKIYFLLVTSLKACKIQRLSSCVIITVIVHCACATIYCLRFTILVTTTLLHHNHTPPPFIAAAYGGPAACCGMAERAHWIDER